MSQKEPDILDQANLITEFMTERAVAQRRAQAAPQFHPDFDGVHCVEKDCGVDMPPERLTARRVRCVECQRIIEKRESAYGR